MLWFAANSQAPVFYSSSLLEAKVIPALTYMRLTVGQQAWLISWIDRRYDKGSKSNNQLVAVEQVLGQIYHWFDGSTAHSH